MKTLRTLIATVAAALLVALPASAQTSNWKIDPNHSSVQFEVRHMAVSTIHGAFGNVTGTVTWDEKNPTRSSTNVTIDTTTVNTGVTQRDNHLKSPDFFNTAKFPTMTFKSTSVKRINGKLQLIGDLTLTGITRSVTLDVTGPSAPQTMKGVTISGFSATGTLKRADYNFGPKFAPPIIGDEIKFTIDIEIDKQ